MTSYEDQMEQQGDAELTAETKARQTYRGTPVTFRVTRNMTGHPRMVTEHVRYADAAMQFWSFVCIHPDDGWDDLQGIRAADTNPYDLSRAGRDFHFDRAAWSIKLEVIA